MDKQRTPFKYQRSALPSTECEKISSAVFSSSTFNVIVLHAKSGLRTCSLLAKSGRVIICMRRADPQATLFVLRVGSRIFTDNELKTEAKINKQTSSASTFHRKSTLRMLSESRVRAHTHKRTRPYTCSSTRGLWEISFTTLKQKPVGGKVGGLKPKINVTFFISNEKLNSFSLNYFSGKAIFSEKTVNNQFLKLDHF